MSEQVTDLEKLITDLRAQLDLAVKALEGIRFANPNEPVDARGMHKIATDTLTQIKGGADDNG